MMRAIQNTVNRVDGKQEKEEELEFEERVPKEYWKYYNITLNFNELFPYRPWNYTIEITPRAPLKNCKIYSLSAKKQQEFDYSLIKIWEQEKSNLQNHSIILLCKEKR